MGKGGNLLRRGPKRFITLFAGWHQPTAHILEGGQPESFFSQEGGIVLKLIKGNTPLPDAVAMMPTLIDDYVTNPESSLVTVRCSPWVANGKVALIGDSAHAIVPFYGQGMNCGFEDCRVLMACLDHCGEDWSSALALYQDLRKPSGDAIAQLALDNFIEMRDKVADPTFLLRKSIEGYLHATYPDKFIPLYTLVTFSPNVAYNEALRAGREADVLLAEIMAMPDVASAWTTDAGKAFIDAIMQQRPPVAYHSGMPGA
jgi:kynurenine 3-monooxygenase